MFATFWKETSFPFTVRNFNGVLHALLPELFYRFSYYFSSCKSYEEELRVHELRGQIHELQVQIHELQVQIYELRVQTHESLNQ